ncbi:hypothetical protein HNY73_011741, partial [Argiope bruennichi]
RAIQEGRDEKTLRSFEEPEARIGRRASRRRTNEKSAQCTEETPRRLEDPLLAWDGGKNRRVDAENLAYPEHSGF